MKKSFANFLLLFLVLLGTLSISACDSTEEPDDERTQVSINLEE